MIKYTNPLHAFNSYNIHYVMIASRTSEAAKVFMNEENNTDSLNAINKVKKLGDSIDYGQKDTAYLVMDTRRFSQFTVNKLQYEVLVNGLENNTSHGNLATSVNMEILDTVGISFINFIQWLINEKMQTNFDGMIFMLRMIFVGQDVSTNTYTTVQSVTIPMHLFNMELSLDHAMGVYNCEFMPNMNFDTTRHNRWLNIASSTTYTTGKGNTLGAMVDDFEGQLNAASLKYFQSANKVLKAAGKSMNENGSVGRLVQYMITIPDSWKAFTYTGSGTNDAKEKVYAPTSNTGNQVNVNYNSSNSDVNKTGESIDAKTWKTGESNVEKPAQANDTNLATTIGSTITDVLDTMFKQVKDVSLLGAGVKTNTGKDITFYKYITGITSTNEVVTVHVDVVQFVVPDVVLNDDKQGTVGMGDSDYYQMVDGKRVPKNYFEFDYLFTGKNNDILSFDMRLQDLQWLIASNLDVGPSVLNGVSSNDVSTSVGTNVPELASIRAFDALLPPINTAAEFENFSRFTTAMDKNKSNELVSTSQRYTKNLSSFYAASPITTTMTIKGNPLIALKFNMNNFLPDVQVSSGGGNGNQISTTSKENYRKEFEQRILQDNQRGGQDTLTRNPDGSFLVKTLGKGSYATSPVFVKVNVRGPKTDFITADTVKGEQFSESILLDNYYVVMKVNNIIEGSNFTQQLELYSHNVYGNGKFIPPSPETINK